MRELQVRRPHAAPADHRVDVGQRHEALDELRVVRADDAGLPLVVLGDEPIDVAQDGFHARPSHVVLPDSMVAHVSRPAGQSFSNTLM